MEIGLLLLGQILEFFIMILLGYLIVKSGLLKADDSKILSVVLVWAVMPCVILNSFQIEFTQEKVQGLLLAFGAAIIVHAVFILFLWGLRIVMKLDAIETTSVMYTNAGNMIIPIVILLLGEEWVLYSSAYVAVQILLMWTHGKAVICGEKRVDIKKIVTNINLIAIIIGIVMFTVGISMPRPLANAVSTVGNMMAPLSMLVTGMIIGNVNLKYVFAEGRLYLIMLLRLVICPLLILLVLYISQAPKWLPNGNIILLITFLAVMTPAASTITQMAQIYDRDSRYAGAINIITTFFCMITMPLLVMSYCFLFPIS